jgi:hypothetical protein
MNKQSLAERILSSFSKSKISKDEQLHSDNLRKYQKGVNSDLNQLSALEDDDNEPFRFTV